MFTALNSDDSVQGEDTTPNYLFERNNENNRGGPRRANGYSVSENLKMEPEFFFRTKNPGYWTLILLPLAIYFADQKFLEQSLPAGKLWFYAEVNMLKYFKTNDKIGIKFPCICMKLYIYHSDFCYCLIKNICI